MKKLPNRTFIDEEEKALPDHKPMKDRLTLVCGSASGDFKVKGGLPLVYHSDNPQVLKRNNAMKSKLQMRRLGLLHNCSPSGYMKFLLQV